jgi:hypothetical protein
MGSYRMLTGLIKCKTYIQYFVFTHLKIKSVAVPKTLNSHLRKAFQMCIVRVQRL